MSILQQRGLRTRQLEKFTAGQAAFHRATTRWALAASRRNWTKETPGISTGYWKAEEQAGRRAFMRGQCEEVLIHCEFDFVRPVTG